MSNAVTLPTFIAEVSGGFLHALSLPLGQGDPLFSLPIMSIIGADVQPAVGDNLHLWTCLCGCCFGGRDVILALQVDAPAGWLHWGPAGVTGPLTLALFVRDVDEWIDAMGIRDLLAV